MHECVRVGVREFREDHTEFLLVCARAFVCVFGVRACEFFLLTCVSVSV